jgi:hypothetical protein
MTSVGDGRRATVLLDILDRILAALDGGEQLGRHAPSMLQIR